MIWHAHLAGFKDSLCMSQVVAKLPLIFRQSPDERGWGSIQGVWLVLLWGNCNAFRTLKSRSPAAYVLRTQRHTREWRQAQTLSIASEQSDVTYHALRRRAESPTQPERHPAGAACCTKIHLQTCQLRPARPTQQVMSCVIKWLCLLKHLGSVAS